MTLLPKDNGINSIQDEKTGDNPLFPVFLKLNELHTVLIGAGNVGLEKLTDASELARLLTPSRTP